MKRGTIRNAISAGLLLVVSLSLSAVAAEITLRLLGHYGAPQAALANVYPVDDPVLDWRYIPRSEVRIGRVVYAYNSAGFRDVDHDVPKPLGTKRIVIVGDSVTEGYTVESESVFARELQTRLGDGFEVINVAAAGLNTPQEVHLFEQEGLRYGPDLVVLNFVLNDGDFYSSYKAAKKYADAKDSEIGLLRLSVSPRFKRLLKSSALIYFVKERMENLQARLLGTEHTDYFTALWRKADTRQVVIDGFQRLAVLQQTHKFAVVVLIWPLIMDYRQYAFADLHLWVEQQAKDRSFATIDLLPTFSRLDHSDLRATVEDNVHPNDVGHRLAADAFLAWFRSADAISSSRR